MLQRLRVRDVAIVLFAVLTLHVGPTRGAGADSTPVAAGPADSTGIAAPDSGSVFYVVLLDKGEALVALHVKRTSRESLRVVLRSGEARFIPVHDVVSIADDKGGDRTREVMEGWDALEARGGYSVTPKEPSRFLRGYPLPERSRYLVMEAGYYYPLSRAKAGRDLTGYGTLQAAYLINLNERYALGPAIQAEYGGSEGRFSAMARGRRWLSRRTSLELALGASIGTGGTADESIRSTSPSLFVQGAFNMSDLMHLTVQAETYSRDYPSWYVTYPGRAYPVETERGVQVLVGGKLGGALGAVGVGASALIYGVLMALVIAGGAGL